MTQLWGGVFSSNPAEETLDYTHTIDIDRRMIGEDLWGSLAHTLMLIKTGIIDITDGKQIVHGLLSLVELNQAGQFTLHKEHEDVHLNIERWLIDHYGVGVGGKVHTARSRNDQVATDTRLYARRLMIELGQDIAVLIETLLLVAFDHTTTLAVGYTHSQVAQPITYGFWLSSHASILLRDLQRVLQAIDTINLNPLGAAAIAGTSFAIDRTMTTELLGFDTVLSHAMDATSGRDFIAEALAAMSLLMIQLSRLAEEIVGWSSYEFGLLKITESFATGSSIMPQKRNPIVAEVARARSATVLGCLVELLTVVKSVPMGYSSDLQQDKPPLWRALDVTRATVRILTNHVATMVYDDTRAEEILWHSFATATELANYLAREKSMAFREAYTVVGNLVKTLRLQEKTLRNFREVRVILQNDNIILEEAMLEEILNPHHVIARQISMGSTGPMPTAQMLALLQESLAAKKSHLLQRRQQIDIAWDKTLRAAKSFTA